RGSRAHRGLHILRGWLGRADQLVKVNPGGSGVQADVAVPQMGVHWVDVRSPELQAMFGNPGGYVPFDATFIYGSWDGRFTFLEPMVTRAFLLTHPDQLRPVSHPAAYPEPGWYPAAYRISYDAQARESRIALTQLAWHNE
ncbi:MAG: hypothetical protein ACWGSQ_05305, partial [Longimicrobiales bacterium]